MTNSPRQVVLTGVNSEVRHTKKQPDPEDVIDLLSDTAASTVTFQIFGCSVYSTASTFVAAYLASSDQVGRGSSKMVTHYIKPSMQLGTHWACSSASPWKYLAHDWNLNLKDEKSTHSPVTFRVQRWFDKPECCKPQSWKEYKLFINMCLCTPWCFPWWCWYNANDSFISIMLMNVVINWN